MTYTQATINARKVETWEHQACLNNRGRILVFVAGRKRFRADTRRRTTIAQLRDAGFVKVHELESKQP